MKSPPSSRLEIRHAPRRMDSAESRPQLNLGKVARETDVELATSLSTIAEYNAACPHIKPLSFFQVLWRMLTNDWQRVGGTTKNLKELILDRLVNTGVVTALLLTVVTISPNEVGNELNTHLGISKDWVQDVFTLLSMCAQAFFFVNIVLAYISYTVLGQCSNIDEVVLWKRSMGRAMDVPYIFLLIGLSFHVAAQSWLAYSLLRPSLYYSFCGLFGILVCFVTICCHQSVQALYQAKYEVGKGFVAEVIGIDGDERIQNYRRPTREETVSIKEQIITIGRRS